MATLARWRSALPDVQPMSARGLPDRGTTDARSHRWFAVQAAHTLAPSADMLAPARSCCGNPLSLTFSCSTIKSAWRIHSCTTAARCKRKDCCSIHEYKFRIMSPVSGTDGAINRVTGRLFAKTDKYNFDLKNRIPLKPIEFVTRTMTCVPAERQF